MNPTSQLYRQACREMELPAIEKKLFLSVLREMSINAVRSRKAWNIREDFITLWWMSAGRFTELTTNPYNKLIGKWVVGQLPFKLTPSEQEFLWG